MLEVFVINKEQEPSSHTYDRRAHMARKSNAGFTPEQTLWSHSPLFYSLQPCNLLFPLTFFIWLICHLLTLCVIRSKVPACPRAERGNKYTASVPVQISPASCAAVTHLSPAGSYRRVMDFRNKDDKEVLIFHRETQNFKVDLTGRQS